MSNHVLSPHPMHTGQYGADRSSQAYSFMEDLNSDVVEPLPLSFPPDFDWEGFFAAPNTASNSGQVDFLNGGTQYPSIVPTPTTLNPSMLDTSFNTALNMVSAPISEPATLVSEHNIQVSATYSKNIHTTQPAVAASSDIGPALNLHLPHTHMSDGFDSSEHDTDVSFLRTPVADQGNLPSGAEFVIEQVLESEDEEVEVAEVRKRDKVSRETRARRTAARKVKDERKEVYEQEADVILARRAVEDAEFSVKHSLSRARTDEVLEASLFAKSTRATSASNALNSRASVFFNIGESPPLCGYQQETKTRWLQAVPKASDIT